VCASVRVPARTRACEDVCVRVNVMFLAVWVCVYICV
jgi:hypothetical protein